MTSDHQPLSDDDLEHARRRQADPLVQVSQTERLLLQEVDRLRAVAEEHRQTARHAYYDVQALQVERERLEGEVDRLRAENTALAERIDEVRELRRTWFQNAEVVRGKADSIPGLTEVERAELRQGAVEMETCARQVGFALGPTDEEDTQFVLKDLDRRIRLDEVGPIHFAPYGGAFTTCGEALPKSTPWSVVRGDLDTSKYTTRRAETTCPQCCAALGLVQDREGQADATA